MAVIAGQGRDREEQSAAGPEDALKLPRCGEGIGNMFENLEADHAVK